MKYKPLTKNQIIISVDRLTRFKSTEEKYLRVFRDIIISNLIEPKFKKYELDKLDYSLIKDFAVQIFNNSLEDDNTKDLTINHRLMDYENSVFKNDKSVKTLLENKLDYKSALKLLDGADIPVNLKWLKHLSKNEELTSLREKYNLKFPISKVVIVEGITEEILLPSFSKFLGYDFLKYGINIIPAGGKNQVVKLYYKYSEMLKIPIFILLDKDAVDNVEAINHKLRKQDKVYLLNSGEFEDLLPKELILKTINSHLRNLSSVSLEELDGSDRMVKILEEIFKTKGIHEFKKAEFASLVNKQIKSESDISEEILLIVKAIKFLAKTSYKNEKNPSKSLK